MQETGLKNKIATPAQKILECKDHLVSGEKFEILDLKNGILKTDPFPEDLNKYYQSEDYISHTDSSKTFQDKIYQIVKNKMLSKKASWINTLSKTGKILDYGAGTGDFLNRMKFDGWEVEGVEPNYTARNLGIKKGLEISSELENISETQFDVITLWHVLEHIPDYQNVVDLLKAKLKPGGFLVIAVPNFKSFDAFYYNNKWAAWDVPRHLWHFSRKGLKNTIEENGFSLLQEKPLIFDSYYVSLLSEKNKGSRFPFPKALLRGFISNLNARGTGEYSSLTYFFQKND
ncbi:class I SAM-dependent methyltransferase [Christiangramia aquimixticola]|uniref:class I SAM-dependent methyltransferase n=1 Tax=Christiangramia aquimixticola TaxID=1697558 RepID=UPI003AA7E646